MKDGVKKKRFSQLALFVARDIRVRIPFGVDVICNYFLSKMLYVVFSASENDGGEQFSRGRWRKPFLT